MYSDCRGNASGTTGYAAGGAVVRGIAIVPGTA